MKKIKIAKSNSVSNSFTSSLSESVSGDDDDGDGADKESSKSKQLKTIQEIKHNTLDKEIISPTIKKSQTIVFKSKRRESLLKQQSDFEYVRQSLAEDGKLDKQSVRKVVNLMLRREMFTLGANFILYQLKQKIPCFASINCCHKRKSVF